MPPEGKSEASGSPWTSSLPRNSVMALPSPVGCEEAVVLLGGQAGHGLKHVGEVRGALFHGPVLHGRGDGVGDGRIERRTLLDGLLQGLEDRLGQPLPLHFSLKTLLPKRSLRCVSLKLTRLSICFVVAMAWRAC